MERTNCADTSIASKECWLVLFRVALPTMRSGGTPRRSFSSATVIVASGWPPLMRRIATRGELEESSLRCASSAIASATSCHSFDVDAFARSVFFIVVRFILRRESAPVFHLRSNVAFSDNEPGTFIRRK